MSEIDAFSFKNALNGNIQSDTLKLGTDAYQSYLTACYRFYLSQNFKHSDLAKEMNRYVLDFIRQNYQTGAEEKIKAHNNGGILLDSFKDFVVKVLDFYNDEIVPTQKKLTDESIKISSLIYKAEDKIDKNQNPNKHKFTDNTKIFKKPINELILIRYSSEVNKIIKLLNKNFTEGLNSRQFHAFLTNEHVTKPIVWKGKKMYLDYFALGLPNRERTGYKNSIKNWFELSDKPDFEITTKKRELISIPETIKTNINEIILLLENLINSELK